MDGQELPYPSGNVQGVQALRGVLVHVVAEHFLQTRFHGITWNMMSSSDLVKEENMLFVMSSNLQQLVSQSAHSLFMINNKLHS